MEVIPSLDELRKLSPDSLQRISDDLKSFVLNATKEKVGHLASSLGVAELTLTLHYLLNTPDDILKVYRDAAKKMVNDPDFKAKATKVLGPYPLTVGEEAGAIIKKAAIFSENTKKQLNKVLKKHKFTYRVK